MALKLLALFSMISYPLCSLAMGPERSIRPIGSIMRGTLRRQVNLFPGTIRLHETLASQASVSFRSSSLQSLNTPIRARNLRLVFHTRLHHTAPEQLEDTNDLESVNALLEEHIELLRSMEAEQVLELQPEWLPGYALIRDPETIRAFETTASTIEREGLHLIDISHFRVYEMQDSSQRILIREITREESTGQPITDNQLIQLAHITSINLDSQHIYSTGDRIIIRDVTPLTTHPFRYREGGIERAEYPHEASPLRAQIIIAYHALNTLIYGNTFSEDAQETMNHLGFSNSRTWQALVMRFIQ